MKVLCQTNLDANLDGYYKEQWPTEMVCRPQKGDLVESESGKVLKICGITHSVIRGSLDPQSEKEPILLIELTKTS